MDDCIGYYLIRMAKQHKHEFGVTCDDLQSGTEPTPINMEDIGCPNCGYYWDGSLCKTCGFFEKGLSERNY